MSCHLLVVEKVPTAQSDLLNLLPNHCKVKFANNSFEAISFLKQNRTFDIIILKENGVPLNAYKAFEYIRNEIKSDIDIIVLTNDVKPDDTLNKMYFSYLQVDIIIAKITEVFNNPKNKYTDNHIVYSLDYLIKVSENDEHFIVQSLKIFKSSVTDKILQLKSSLKSDDYGEIAEIAHSIKPSFQMIENQKCVYLCDLLNNRASTGKLPGLVKELESEFEKIKNQLEIDFPQLR